MARFSASATLVLCCLVAAAATAASAEPDSDTRAGRGAGLFDNALERVKTLLYPRAAAAAATPAREDGDPSGLPATFAAASNATNLPAPRRGLEDASGWSHGRVTWYGGPNGAGPDGMSLYTGSCGLGDSIPDHYVAAWHTDGGYDWGLTDKCGQCVEVMCVHGATRGHDGSKLGPWEGCQEAGRRSIVVQVTDSCPCHHPNGGSNGRWCCGDATHIDLSYAAFDFIALRDRGVADVRWRQVGCDRRGQQSFFDADTFGVSNRQGQQRVQAMEGPPQQDDSESGGGENDDNDGD